MLREFADLTDGVKRMTDSVLIDLVDNKKLVKLTMILESKHGGQDYELIVQTRKKRKVAPTTKKKVCKKKK